MPLLKYFFFKCRNNTWFNSQELTELDREIDRRKQQVLDRGDSLQPFIIVIGNTIDSIESIYVYVDGTRYLMESILQAIDVCFKLYQALDAEYPTTGLNLWNFIQRYVFNIHTNCDFESSSQDEVAVDLCIEVPVLK